MITKEKWEELKPYAKYKAINPYGETVRISREDTTGFEYAKGKSRYGRRYGIDYILQNYTLVPEKDENSVWHKRIDRAIKAIEISGLWSDLVDYFKNLSLMNYMDKEEISRLYWERHSDIFHYNQKLTNTEHNRIFDQIFNSWVFKYPFIVYQNANGYKFLNEDYIFEKSEVKIKSMNFGSKTANEEYKSQIKKHIEAETAYSITRVRTNYDVSFEYNPDKKKAWYSEEYKNCGNGHYYIALDHNTALFVEDD